MEVAARGGRVAAGSALPSLPKDIARLDVLPLDEREVLLLAALVGMSYAQIADTLHVPLSTVMSRLGQARAALPKRADHCPPAIAALALRRPRPARVAPARGEIGRRAQ